MSIIRTQYPITVEVNDVKYELLYKAPSKAKQAELQKELDGTNGKFEELRRLEEDISLIEEEKRLNDEILASLNEQLLELDPADKEKATSISKEKMDAVKEQLKLLKDIKVKAAKRNELLKEKLDLNNYAKKRFDATISGAGKTDFVKVIKTENISYFEVMNVIDSLLNEAKTKK